MLDKEDLSNDKGNSLSSMLDECVSEKESKALRKGLDIKTNLQEVSEILMAFVMQVLDIYLSIRYT